jgi:prepilin-type N-terminal cleavage/methylation domain-containing protein/prepilin-type processing-associated H-X9-DG protein
MKKAFTLIELLVVIAIIAILAAILFPVFAQAKLAAKKTADLSNIKQIMLSTFMYTNDYDDILPTIRNDPDQWAGGGQMASPAWNSNVNFETHDIVQQLAPYIKNQQIWQSPEDSFSHCTTTSGVLFTSASKIGSDIDYVPTYNGQQDVLATPSSGYNAVTAQPESYGVFGLPWSVNALYGGPTTGSLSTTQVSSPADLIIFCPMFITWSNYTGFVQWRTDQREYSFYDPALGLPVPNYPAQYSTPYAWCSATDGLSMESFNGTTNWAFADGHAKAMPRSATMDPTWETNPTAAIAGFKKNMLDANPGYN